MSERAAAAKGCVGVFGSMAVVLLVGSCVFGGRDKTDAAAASETPAIETTPAESESPSPNYVVMSPEEHRRAMAEWSPREEKHELAKSGGGTSEISKTEAKASKRNQRDVDKAAGTVAFIIGLNNYPCIKVIDVQQTASPSLYGVECITDHNGHRANYMVNAQTNDVSEI